MFPATRHSTVRLLAIAHAPPVQRRRGRLSSAKDDAVKKHKLDENNNTDNVHHFVFVSYRSY